MVLIDGFDEEKFALGLAAMFTPAQPISTQTHLYGRDRNLADIKNALRSPGKHVFIYGDRGVGKTSLAKTAARLNAMQNDPVFVSCDSRVDFFGIIASIVRNIFNNSRIFRQDCELEISLGFMKYKKGMQIKEFSLKSINDVMDALVFLTRDNSEDTIVIIDEFDVLSSIEDKKYFADLIKQISDRAAKIRVIICGIGTSLEELIGVHLSTERYLSAISLRPISHDAMWRIIEAAAAHFRIAVDKEILYRISQISDGYPYYTHLMGEKIFQEVYEDVRTASEVSREHYRRGIRRAIEESQTSLKSAYEKATQKYSNVSHEYEEVLWSVADGDPTPRPSAAIFEKSYLKIMDQLSEKPPLARERFNARLNALKKQSHGTIVLGNRQGWYRFRENMVRGYVRLRAEDNGVQIGVDLAR